jgi:hypothetical protein
MHLRLVMSSSANTDNLYSDDALCNNDRSPKAEYHGVIVHVQRAGENGTLVSILCSITTALSLTSHPLCLTALVFTCPLAYPFPCVLSDELVEGPQLFFQIAVPETPHIRLCFDRLRQLTDRCERGKSGCRDEAIPHDGLGSCRGVRWNGSEWAQRMYAHR